MRQIDLSSAQAEAAASLGEGAVIYAYKDGNAVRMETERGNDPWVWRGGEWRRMRNGR
jgi:hypothetical protein